MEDWTKKTDAQVFGAVGEQINSQASYWRQTEIQRRLYLLEKRGLELQIDAANAQKEAVAEQRQAIKEMRRQSTFMLWSAIGAFLAAFATVVAAFIS